MSRYSPRLRLTNTTSTAAVANWFGNQFVSVPGSYESIATLNAAAGGSASLEFTSIPSTYTHLEIRGISRTSYASISTALVAQFNSDTGSNYFHHLLYGDGASAASAAVTSSTSFGFGFTAGNTATASSFGGHLITILDYKNTNKIKTVRGLTGADNNGNGQIRYVSGAWNSTNAITSIKIFDANGGNLSQYTTFALYGIKGA